MLIRKLHISNYKSIRDLSIDLGRVNVFIGENGCGKTNLLEALGMAAAALSGGKLSPDECALRGIRVAQPELMRSSFLENSATDIKIGLEIEDPELGHLKTKDRSLDVQLRPSVSGSGHPTWIEVLPVEGLDKLNKLLLETLKRENVSLQKDRPRAEAIMQRLVTTNRGLFFDQLIRSRSEEALEDYGIYDANSAVLRGLAVVSRRTPLGLFGENLDRTIAQLPKKLQTKLQKSAQSISWLSRFVTDPDGALGYGKNKVGNTTSSLYFHDKHMREDAVLSAENANEGILHVLFHLALFMSPKTPSIFGVDNVETALNPGLCRNLVVQLSDLAVTHQKQALITTHNPAVLDGLNLLDDEQRLFVVSRDDEGATTARRIKTKPAGDRKLSELWMRGMLGGVPETF